MKKMVLVTLASVSLTSMAAQTDISPFGKVKVAGSAPAAASVAAVPAVPKSGEEIYNTTCMVCHLTGAANAPRLGDKAAWEPRIAAGIDALVKVAIAGKPPSMPPKGGNMSLSEADIRKTVEYMVAKSQ